VSSEPGAAHIKQRALKDKMNAVRRQRLEALPGWSWNTLEDKWELGFSQLRKFFEREGHCRVPYGYKTDDGYALGQWVRVQRPNDKLEPVRRQRLEALPGWSWDVFSDQWEEGFSHLKQFSEREGHCRVPDKYKTEDGYGLGIWISTQRTNKDLIDAESRKRLEALPGWSWDVLSDQWEEGFTHLRAFSNREGHCRVPAKYKTEDGYRLGSWINKQRTKKDLIDAESRKRLEALPGWSWNTLVDQWEEGFSHLKQFSEREGHCRVPAKYKTDDGYRLGSWITNQRSRKDAMRPDRCQRLEALPGWTWDVLSDQWEEGFSHLKQFSEREGHCRVPREYKIEDGYRLGQWVGVQRHDDKLDLVRRQRLEALPGWSWNTLEDEWELGFSQPDVTRIFRSVRRSTTMVALSLVASFSRTFSGESVLINPVPHRSLCQPSR
jgi:Helicase associated domain